MTESPPIKEFYIPSQLPEDFKSRDQIQKLIKKRTTKGDAEILAFNKAKNLAKKLGYNNIFYKSYKNTRPDLKNKDGHPRKYTIEVILFN